MLSSDDPHTTMFGAGSNDKQQYLQASDQDKSSNAPKKKSMERISKLFQKKSKKQSMPPPPTSLTPSFSSVSLSSSNYDQQQPQNNQHYSTPPTVSSTKSTTSKRSSSLRIPFRVGGNNNDSEKQNDMTNGSIQQAQHQRTTESRSSIDNSPFMTKQGSPSILNDDSSITTNSIKAGKNFFFLLKRQIAFHSIFA